MHPEFLLAAVGTDLDHRFVHYGPEPEQVADVLVPAGAGRAPLVIVIHGGFWRTTYDRGHTAAQCVALARAGYVVAALEYRRVGGGGGWPHTFADVGAGVDALPGLLAGPIDSSRVVLMGHSAGGHLALWAAGRHRLPVGAPGRRSTPAALAGVVSLAGVADLGWAVAAGLGDGAIADLLGVAPEADPDDRYGCADPARLLPTGVRTICLHGELDDAVPPACASAYVAAARAAGDPAEVRLIDWCGHFEPITPGSDAWPAVLRAAEDLTR